jgi:hypothetical protein
MAYVRQWQFPYELNYPGNGRGQFTQGGSDYLNETTTDPFTGDRSIYDSSVNRMFSGMAFEPGLDEFRWAYTLKSLTNVSDYYLCGHYAAGNGGTSTPDLHVIWDSAEYSYKLFVAGIQRDEVSALTMQNYANLNLRTFNHIGFHSIDSTRFVMYINGQEIFNYANAIVPGDIEFAGAGYVAGSGTYGQIIDDMYFDTAVGESAEIPPMYRFLYSNTNGDGTSQDWASKSGGTDWSEVDDSEIDDDDSYVWIGSSGSDEFFNTTNITVPDGHSIVAAIPVAVARKGTASLGSQLQMATDNGVNPTDYGTAKDLATWYFETWDRFENDPAGNPWSQVNFNSAEFGMRTQGTV